MSNMVVDPVRRQRYRFWREGDDLLAEVETDPGGDVPEHIHPGQTERWEVLQGDVTFIIDGQRRHARPGDQICAEAGHRHAFVNDGATMAVLRVRVSPAGAMQEFLTEAAQLATSGAFNQRGLPSSPAGALAVARLALRYRAELAILSPRFARLLNLLGRMLPAPKRKATAAPGSLLQK